MSRRKKQKKNFQEKKSETPKEAAILLHPEIKKSVWIIMLLGLAILFLLAGIGQAGSWGGGIYSALFKLFGWGYYLFPAILFLLAFSLVPEEQKKILKTTLVAGFFFFISGLGFMDIVAPGSGGLTGAIIGSLKEPFGIPASIVMTLTIVLAAFIVMVNRPLKFSWKKVSGDDEAAVVEEVEYTETESIQEGMEGKESEKKSAEAEISHGYLTHEDAKKLKDTKTKPIKNYVPPPLSLLSSSVEKPTIGDLRANANIIKRTLEGFGISVEMGEINVGPTVTRYTLKPAEGMRLSKITALNQDLALALAAHPIRIEAPIPGKSLVGIEVPNKSAAIVRLGSILLYPEFQKPNPLIFALGRNVSGEPIFADIDKMPHLLIAGATGSGKSIAIHSLLISLLYKNSPEMLRLILIDPKRVELSVYDGIPHLLTPVITENKKAIGVLRWAIQEMERRYQILQESGSRDIKSYHQSRHDLPYILIIVDELADLMVSYGREVEGSIIRLAQMARATGIHLIVSTQRPSVEVITGLIKANITSRLALQVASQVDSRTILDASGAEKLLGNGDLLYISAEFSKPKRIQGAFLTEEEIKKVTSFIKKNNEQSEEQLTPRSLEEPDKKLFLNNIEEYAESDEEDELYGEALETVRAAKKASASLLQRRLKIGYARAARLLDIMEDRGIVGPGEGAKPREVYE